MRWRYSTHRQRSLGLIRLQRGMLRDHGFDKYEGALAALVERRDGLSLARNCCCCCDLVAYKTVLGKVADRALLMLHMWSLFEEFSWRPL